MTTYVHPSATSVDEVWNEYLYGTTAEGFMEPLDCSREEAVDAFMREVMEDNVFGLDGDELNKIDVDFVKGNLLAYLEKQLGEEE